MVILIHYTWGSMQLTCLVFFGAGLEIRTHGNYVTVCELQKCTPEFRSLPSQRNNQDLEDSFKILGVGEWLFRAPALGILFICPQTSVFCHLLGLFAMPTDKPGCVRMKQLSSLFPKKESGATHSSSSSNSSSNSSSSNSTKATTSM